MSRSKNSKTSLNIKANDGSQDNPVSNAAYFEFRTNPGNPDIIHMLLQNKPETDITYPGAIQTNPLDFDGNIISHFIEPTAPAFYFYEVATMDEVKKYLRNFIDVFLKSQVFQHDTLQTLDEEKKKIICKLFIKWLFYFMMDIIRKNPVRNWSPFHKSDNEFYCIMHGWSTFIGLHDITRSFFQSSNPLPKPIHISWEPQDYQILLSQQFRADFNEPHFVSYFDALQSLIGDVDAYQKKRKMDTSNSRQSLTRKKRTSRTSKRGGKRSTKKPLLLKKPRTLKKTIR